MSQSAAVIAENAGPGNWTTVAQVAIPEPPAGKIIVKTVAFAANPTDWKHIAFQQGSPGDIAGSDASGVVYKVGEGVTGFEVGDVVSTFSHGNFSKTRGCFAEYIIGDTETTIKYKKGSFKDKLPQGEYRAGTVDTWEGAASLSLGLSTAVLSLVGNLNVQPSDAGKYLLIWGGSTATGILAIQVAKLGLGLKVITTASKKNHEFLKSVGADLVFDYNDANVVDEIRKAANGDIRYALDAVSTPETWQSLYDATKGSSSVKLDSLLFKKLTDLKLDDRDSSTVELVSSTLAYLANGETVTLFGGSWSPIPEVQHRYNKFWETKVPELAAQLIHAKLRVLAPGLKSTNEAFDLLKEDKVSGEKVVFRLD